MDRPESSTPNDALADRLAAYDRALAAGQTPPAADNLSLGSEERAQLDEAQAFLAKVERLWPRSPALEPGATGDGATPEAPLALGRFRLLRVLGRGGFGIVYLADDPLLGRPVAVKVPRPETLLTPDLRRRFLREARAAAALSHPHIVPVFETGEAGPLCYLVSAYCPGGTLADWLKARPTPVPVRAAAALVARLAEAVQHAHDRGILHRDLKPGNVLLEPAADDPATAETLGMVPRVIDFGLAKLREGEPDEAVPPGDDDGLSRAASESAATRSSVWLGTPRYMAPEQAERRRGAVGPATDVHALGLILYELLTGQPAFPGPSDLDALRQVVQEEPAPLRRLRSDVPRDLEAVCLKCLQKDPARRYPTAQTLAEDLRRHLAGQPVAARPSTRWERTSKWARRRPAVAALVAVSGAALLGLVLGGVGYSVQLQRHNAALQATAEREQRILAEGREQQLRRLLYASQFRLMHQARESGQRASTLEWLEQQRPQPGQEDLRSFAWYYLRELCLPFRAIWRGHRTEVGLLFVAPDGRTVASGGRNETKLWDLASGRVLAEFQGEPVGFSPDGRTLVFWRGEQPQAIMRDLATGQEKVAMALAEGRLRWFPLPALQGQTMAVAIGSSVKLCDLGTGEQVILRPEPEQKEANAVRLAIAPDGQILAVGFQDGSIRWWDLPTARERPPLAGHAELVSSLAFTPDGRTLASASFDKTVKLWDVASGRLRTTLHGHRAGIRALAITADGRTLATGTKHGAGELKLWDVENGHERAHFDRDFSGIDALAFTPDSRLLLLGCYDYTVKVLEPDRAAPVEVLSGHTPMEVWSLAFAPDGRTLASAGDDHLVRLWDVPTGREWAPLPEHDSLVTSVAFVPDGRTLASGSYDQTVKLWDTQTGALRGSLPGPMDRVRCLAFSPDGRLLAAGHLDTRRPVTPSVRLWQVATGQGLPPLPGHMIGILSLAFSLDGTTLAVASLDGTIWLWDTVTWQCRQNLRDTDQV
jgi:WD40 repeat protein/serine/threonine protein kinase